MLVLGVCVHSSLKFYLIVIHFKHASMLNEQSNRRRFIFSQQGRRDPFFGRNMNP